VELSELPEELPEELSELPAELSELPAELSELPAELYFSVASAARSRSTRLEPPQWVGASGLDSTCTWVCMTVSQLQAASAGDSLYALG